MPLRLVARLPGGHCDEFVHQPSLTTPDLHSLSSCHQKPATHSKLGVQNRKLAAEIHSTSSKL